jgi:hypothetical protein
VVDHAGEAIAAVDEATASAASNSMYDEVYRVVSRFSRGDVSSGVERAVINSTADVCEAIYRAERMTFDW